MAAWPAGHPPAGSPAFARSSAGAPARCGGLHHRSMLRSGRSLHLMPGAPHIGDSGSTTIFRWEILIPTQRYVFTVNSGRLEEYNREGELSFHRFSRYQSLKADHPVHGMVAWPNTVLLSGPATVVVDPGLVMQGEPLLAALAERGLSAGDVDLVVNTHAHMDHVQANVYFPGTPIVIHEAEFGGSPAHERSGFDGRARLLSGDEGEIAPGLRFLRTPGHRTLTVPGSAQKAQAGSDLSFITAEQPGTPVKAGALMRRASAEFRLVDHYRGTREVDVGLNMVHVRMSIDHQVHITRREAPLGERGQQRLSLHHQTRVHHHSRRPAKQNRVRPGDHAVHRVIRLEALIAAKAVKGELALAVVFLQPAGVHREDVALGRDQDLPAKDGSAARVSDVRGAWHQVKRSSGT